MPRNRYFYGVVSLLVLWGLTAFWGLNQLQAKRRAEMLLQNKYNRAFYEAIQRTKNVEALLSKGLVSASPGQMDRLFSDLWYNASAAQDNLNQLPVSHNVLARTSKFLAQVGDYAYSLTKQNRTGALSDDDWKTMEKLYSSSISLNRELIAVEHQAATGRFRWTEVRQGLIRNLPQGTVATADRSFRHIETQLQEVPVLVYDGPFSDHIQLIKPMGLTGNMVTVEQAREIARRFIDLSGSKIRSVRTLGITKGKIPAYRFEFRVGDRKWEIATVDVSRKGGHIVNMINPREVSRSSLSDEEGQRKAQNFLVSWGVASMVPTYSLRQQNILTVSFVSKQNDIVIYPDLIKVQVALDNGQILGYEALGFLMSHHQRKLPQPKLTLEQASARLSPRLKASTGRLALIPTSAKDEVLTYEFKGQLGKDTFLVYINALTGDEQQILKLLKLPHGTLSL